MTGAVSATVVRPPLLSTAALLGVLLLPPFPAARAGEVVINEVSDKGTDGVCGGGDWVELYHVPGGDDDGGGSEAVDLGGYVLHDDGGPYDDEAFMFPPGDGLSMIHPGQYLVLCAGGTDSSSSQSPRFGIGSDDTLTLRPTAESDPVSIVGPLPGGGRYGITYARLTPDGTYGYTATPTPGYANVLVPPDPEPETEGDETAYERKERMAARNALGDRFFGMGEGGLPVPDPFEEVLDLRIEMDDADFDYVMDNPSFKVYRPFQSAKVLRRSDGTEIASLPSPGRIRTKGRYNLIYTACKGIRALPFSLDFDSTDPNQTLFGSSRVYLRNRRADKSCMREWALHRVLARFGLPYLRARPVRFYLNGELLGFYELMESPEQEHVFARSFPDYDPHNFALYKVKGTTRVCGKEKYFSPENMAVAEVRAKHASLPPYGWERGEHRERIPVYANGGGSCSDIATSGRSWEDFLVAYVRHGYDCGRTAVEVGVLDRDIGVKSWDDAMADFCNKHLNFTGCSSSSGCPESDLASDVDLTNFLKSLAFYAVMLSFDGPLTKSKNMYLAQSGDGNGWKMVVWDIDGAMKASDSCGDMCEGLTVHWSILTPTCEDIGETPFAGPLLSDPYMLRQYVEHVRELTAILSDTSFLQELADHAVAIREDAEADIFLRRKDYDYSQELSPDAGEWDSEYNPFLPMLAARTKDVMAQLDALDGCAGAYRSPELAGEDNPCMDWRVNNTHVQDPTLSHECLLVDAGSLPTEAPQNPPTAAPQNPPTASPQSPTAAPQSPTSAPQSPTSAPQSPTSAPQSPTSVPQSTTGSPTSPPTSAPQSPPPTDAPPIRTGHPSASPRDTATASPRPTGAPQGRPTEAPTMRGGVGGAAASTAPPSELLPAVVADDDPSSSARDVEGPESASSGLARRDGLRTAMGLVVAVIIVVSFS